MWARITWSRDGRVTVVFPHDAGGRQPTDADAAEALTRHVGGPGHVFLALLYMGEAEPITDRQAIFSTASAALRWIETYRGRFDGAIVSPYVIDEPDFGNVAKEQQH